MWQELRAGKRHSVTRSTFIFISTDKQRRVIEYPASGGDETERVSAHLPAPLPLLAQTTVRTRLYLALQMYLCTALTLRHSAQKGHKIKGSDDKENWENYKFVSASIFTATAMRNKKIDICKLQP